MVKIPEKRTMAKSSGSQKGRWLPFWMHSFDTEAVMAYLLRHWISAAAKQELRTLVNGQMPPDELYRTGRFLALGHDIGKLTAEFQEKITKFYPEIKDRISGDLKISWKTLPGKANPHALMGQRILLRGCERAQGPLAIACIIGAHHGKPADTSNEGENPYDPDKRWEHWQEKWVNYALQESGYSKKEELPAVNKTAQMLWTGLLIMADWIASNPAYFSLISVDNDGGNVDYNKRRQRAIQKIRLTEPSIPSECWDREQLYRDRFGFSPNPVQNMMSEAAAGAEKPGIFILEAQMGVGKTEAALAAAEMIAPKTRHSGIYFGLPTQATANGIFGRIKSWVEQQSTSEDHSIRLLHSSAELNEDYESLLKGQAQVDDEEEKHGVIVHQWFSGRKQALLADFVIGTVDQLLMAGLRQKHVMLRHLGLANKIVIVDECHAYDAYMNRYLEAVLHWLGEYHVPVILLSATLPADRRKEYILAYLNLRECSGGDWTKTEKYPLLTYTDGEVIQQKSVSVQKGENHFVELSFAPWVADDFQALAEELREKLREGGCVGIILNTVRRAQNCAEVLRQYFREEDLHIIHAQYLMTDRAQRERQLAEKLGKKSILGNGRPKRLIVVGTQVLEQSLDIDFDYLITDLCPMDLLLQRIGRLHRHGGRLRPANLDKASCRILCGGEELEAGAAAIYGAYLLIRTRELLRERNKICLPADISPLVQKTYGNDWEPPEAGKEYRQAKIDDEEKMRDKRQRASAFCISSPLDGSRRYPYCYSLLENRINDHKGIAAVRDGDPSLDVLCFRRGPHEKLYFMNDRDFSEPLSPERMPLEADARRIARERLRLPHKLCVAYNINDTISELEKATESWVKEWLYSPWLVGELFLIFDEDGMTRLGGFSLRYSEQNGLETVKEEA